MKIVNIILSSVNGGAEQVFIDYLSVLKKLNHQLLAITKSDAPYKNKVLELGVELKTINNHFGYHDFFAIKKIRKILTDFDADAVIAHVGRSMILVKKAAKGNKKIKIIGVNHSPNVKRSIGCDLIFSVNKEIFFKTIAHGQSETASFIMPNAIDLSDADAEKTLVNFAAKQQITIGALGRFQSCKGFHLLILALKKLQNQPQKFSLKLAGSGEEEKNLKHFVKNLDLENAVEFCGWIGDKKKFFSEIDIFCLPSVDGETFGLVILEAMKYQKPIITSNCDGPRDIIRHEIDGLVFDVHSKNEEKIIEEIAQKILQLSSNNNLAEKMVENAAKRVREKFSYASLETRLREIFR